MLVEQLYALERENGNSIHLFKVGVFYEAYEKSCFLFHRLLFPYQVKCRFVKKIQQYVVNLGFSEKGLVRVRERAESQGFFWKQVDEKHVEISACETKENFEKWKESVVADACPENAVYGEGLPKPRYAEKDLPQNLLVAEAVARDLCVYLSQRSVGFQRDFKYTLGKRIQDNSRELLEMLYLHLKGLDSEKANAKLRVKRCCIQSEVRLLLSLHQLNQKQYLFASQKIDCIRKNITGRNSAVQGLRERIHKESGDTLPPIHSA